MVITSRQIRKEVIEVNELYIDKNNRVYLNGKEIQGVLSISLGLRGCESYLKLELIGTCMVDSELSMMDVFEYLTYIDETKNEFTHISFVKEDVNRNRILIRGNYEQSNKS